RKYLLGLILQEKQFSVRRISKNTQEIKPWQFYDFLESKINWKNLFYQLAKLVIPIFKALNFYLAADGTPLKQPYAKNRITKRGLVNIAGMKNIPQNEMISIGLTNGTIYIPLDFCIWVSSKVSKPKDYKKKTDMFLNLMKKYILMQIPVKTIMFDSYFASKKIIKWLNKNGFVWFTRIKKNRIVYVNGNKCQLQKSGLNYDKSIVCKMNGITQQVKILRFCLQNEEYYICSNNINLTDDELKSGYLKRWKVEVFHREAKQKLGLEYLMMQSWKKLTNHVGFVCLAYSLLTVLKQLSCGSIGDVKFKLTDEIFQLSSAIDIFDRKLAA
ncbi:MAG: transposase, partial [Candidatus Gastranaerophilales bacterium]|nr:transposase [Candidatus Gastranaerophilales bacterium]